MKKVKFNDQKNLLSKKLKIARIENDLTQVQLAAKMQTLGINMDQQMISKIENNTRIVTDYEFIAFCCFLKLNPQEILQEFYNKYIF